MLLIRVQIYNKLYYHQNIQDRKCIILTIFKTVLYCNVFYG